MTHSRRMLVPLLSLFALGGCAAITGPDGDSVASSVQKQVRATVKR